MIKPFAYLHHRVQQREIHGRDHIQRQRRLALILVITAMCRAAAWTVLIILYLLHVPFTTTLFKSVAFVAVISLYANAATDFSQGAASLAQLAATDAHHDSEANRKLLSADLPQIEEDIARLAALQPGPESEALAQEIRSRLRS